MFTSIVEELGSVASLEGDRLRINAKVVLEGVALGDSTAVNGCCLTVVACGDDWWEADVSEETFARTNLGALAPGDPVTYTEPMFDVVIMALASSRPIVLFAERTLNRLAMFGAGTAAAWWLVILSVGPLLGSFITEPAAMTICALLLSRQFFDL